MPICPNNKFLFVHIPKTGGTSIEQALDAKRLFSLNEKVMYGVRFAPQHYTPPILRSILGSEYEALIKFCFVRNPYTRMVSEYFWHHRSKQRESFKRWLPRYLKDLDTDHKLTQSAFVEDGFEFVGRFERLQDDYRVFATKHGLNPVLRKFNATPGSTELLAETMPKRSIGLINEVYKDDFIRFDYKMRK